MIASGAELFMLEQARRRIEGAFDQVLDGEPGHRAPNGKPYRIFGHVGEEQEGAPKAVWFGECRDLVRRWCDAVLAAKGESNVLFWRQRPEIIYEADRGGVRIYSRLAFGRDDSLGEPVPDEPPALSPGVRGVITVCPGCALRVPQLFKAGDEAITWTCTRCERECTLTRDELPPEVKPDDPEPAKIASIHGGRIVPTGEPNQALIDMLRDTLARAESGELQSFIGCGFVMGGHRLSLWCDAHPDVYQMLGSLAWLQHEYVHRHAT